MKLQIKKLHEGYKTSPAHADHVRDAVFFYGDIWGRFDKAFGFWSYDLFPLVVEKNEQIYNVYFRPVTLREWLTNKENLWLATVEAINA